MNTPIPYDGYLCGDCTFCCWSLGVEGVPWLGLELDYRRKPENQDCWQLLDGDRGCDLHASPTYPSQCRAYVCPHILLQLLPYAHQVQWSSGRPFGVPVHRPDVFGRVLAKAWVEARGVMPLVPTVIPVAAAEALIRTSKMVLAARALPDQLGFVAVFQVLTKTCDGEAARRQWAVALGVDYA